MAQHDTRFDDDPADGIEPLHFVGKRDIARFGFEEDEIPTITPDMLDRERVDLEAGMRMFPPVTLMLMLLCAYVHVMQISVGGLKNTDRFVATGAMVRHKVLDGEYWRLISSGFMHANAEHLLGNLVMLFVLGMACEHAFGRGPFLFLYIVACVAGSLLSMGSTVPTVGASGAIFGLAGALVAMVVNQRHRIELRDHRVGFVLAIWTLYTLGLGALSPIVSNTSHLGGLAAGALLGGLLTPVILNDKPAESLIEPLNFLLASLAAIALITTAYCFIPHLA
jgi:rhomboid protease GluP